MIAQLRDGYGAVPVSIRAARLQTFERSEREHTVVPVAGFIGVFETAGSRDPKIEWRFRSRLKQVSADPD